MKREGIQIPHDLILYNYIYTLCINEVNNVYMYTLYIYETKKKSFINSRFPDRI